MEVSILDDIVYSIRSRGPQSLTKTVTNKQRDLHPSYTGRLSLIASSASDPGLSGTLTPFIEEYDSYFEKQK